MTELRNMSEQSEQKEKPYPEYPAYCSEYAPKIKVERMDIWDKPIVILWLVISGFLVLASLIGFIVMYANDITVEQILIAMFAIGSVSTACLIVYWLTFHDIKGEC